MASNLNIILCAFKLAFQASLGSEDCFVLQTYKRGQKGLLDAYKRTFKMLAFMKEVYIENQFHH